MNRIGQSRPGGSRLIFLVLALALVLSVGAVPAQARAAATVTNLSVPTELYVYIPCALGGMGEFVYLTGPLHILTVTIVGSKGGFSSKTLFQPQGISGTGEASGARYQATGETGDIFIGRVGQEYTYVNNFKIVGQGPGNNYMVHENYHYTVNPDGTMTAYLDHFTVECKYKSYP
jgi:hypothetical protein